MTLRAPHFSGKRPLIAAVTVFAVFSVSLALIEGISAKPFAQNDWPNPTLAVKVQTPFQVGNPLTLMEDAGEKPFLQTEWPNPTVAIKVQTPVQAVNPLSITVDTGAKPFLQTEWPDPAPVVIQTPFQHQKHTALTEIPLTPISFIPQNPVFPIAQQPFYLQKALVLFGPCDFGLTGFISATPTDISTTISENVDILGTISENIDLRGLISTDPIDLGTTILENIDLSTTICET